MIIGLFLKPVIMLANGAGTWEETIAPEAILKLDEETMPHVIIREANGAFTYRQLDEASALASIGNTSVPGIPTSMWYRISHLWWSCS
jgi:hypothetical protein